jgi:hypothetical protein
MNHSPYSLDLVCSDFHLFELMKVYLERQQLQTDDEIKHGALKWPCSQDETFLAAGISNLPGRWKKC